MDIMQMHGKTWRLMKRSALALAAIILVQPAAQAAATTLLVDYRSSGDVAATAANFQANDANVDLSATVNNVSAAGTSTFGAFTVVTGGSTGFWQGGGTYDNQPILEGYMYTDGTTRTVTISGLSSVPSGQTFTLTLYGVGNNTGQASTFTPTYGSSLGAKTTVYGTTPIVQWTFVSNGSTDTLTINWVKSGASGNGGFNGFSLTAIAPPTITATATLTGFSTTCGTASAAQSFAVSGANLTANITVAALAGFEFSTDSEATWASTATFTQSGGSASGTLYVRLAATAAIGTYNSQNIVLSSSGATAVNVTTAASGNSVVGAATKLVITSDPVSTTAGVASGTITVERRDAGNNPITLDPEISVTLSSDSTGTKTFSPASLTIASGASSATFTYTDTKVGTPIITAACSPLTSGAQTETVTPDTASKLAFDTQPSTTTAGSAISPAVTVLVQDQYGNTVTTDSSSVTIGSGTTAFTGGTLTVSAISGVATFSAIQPTTAGSSTLTASDGSLDGATSIAFTVNPAAATKLVFTTAPVSTVAGAASGNITVQRQDQYDNPNTTDASRTVTLTSSSSGTKTFTPASPLTIANGSSSATFTYTDTSVGTPTITAASTSPDTITSATQTETISSLATITWGAAVDVTENASDVLVNGAHIDAVTTYGSDVTLNGVTFKHYSSHSGSGPYNLVFGTSGISMTYPEYNLNFTANPETTAYQQLRHTSRYAQNGTGTITLRNLTPGTYYQVQVWGPDWNGSISVVFDGQVTILGRNYSQSQPSQYAVGTFMAEGTTQVINFAAGATGGFYCFAPTAVSLRELPRGTIYKIR